MDCNKVAENNIKEYVDKISELEFVINKQKKLMREGEAVLRLLRPGVPGTDGRTPPNRPKLPLPLATNQLDAKHITLYLSLLALGGVVFYAGIHVFLQNRGAIGWPIFLMAVGCIAGLGAVMLACLGWKTMRSNRRKNEDAQAAHIEEMERYFSESAQFEDYRQVYFAAYERYCSLEAIYDAISDHLKTRNAQTLDSLEKALQDLYRQGIIPPQYRNMRAMMSIAEYLEGGLCDKLEGPGGAYALYEEEKRQEQEQWVEFDGQKRPLMKSFKWRGRSMKIMCEIRDEKYGRVQWVYLDHIKEYIIDGEIVKDQTIIDYIDDHYGRPVAERNILY